MKVVPTNDDRIAVNNSEFERYLRAHPLPQVSTSASSATVRAAGDRDAWRARSALRVRAVLDRSKRSTHGALSEDELDYVRRRRMPVLAARSDSSLKSEGELDLIIGRPYMILGNLDTTAGITNGTLATLVDIVLSSRAKPFLTPVLRWGEKQHSGTQQVHTIAATDVEALVFEHTDSHYRQQRLHSPLPTGHFPIQIRPDDKLEKITPFPRRRDTVLVKQFLCTPAFAITGHKLQGRTLPSLVVTGWGHHAYGGDGWLYVVLSRVRTFSSLYLMEPLRTPPELFQCRIEIVREVNRLRTTVFGPSVTRLRAAGCNVPDAVPPIQFQELSQEQLKANDRALRNARAQDRLNKRKEVAKQDKKSQAQKSDKTDEKIEKKAPAAEIEAPQDMEKRLLSDPAYNRIAMTCELSQHWDGALSIDALYAKHAAAANNIFNAANVFFGGVQIPQSSCTHLLQNRTGYAGGFQNSNSRCYMNSLWFLLQRMPCFRAELSLAFDGNRAGVAAMALTPHARRIGPILHSAMRFADVANFLDGNMHAQAMYDTAQALLLRAYSLQSRTAWWGFRPMYSNSVLEAFWNVAHCDSTTNSFNCFASTFVKTAHCTLCNTKKMTFERYVILSVFI